MSRHLLCGCATSMFFVYKFWFCVHTVGNEDQRIHIKWDKYVIYLSFSFTIHKYVPHSNGCWVLGLLQIMNSHECRTWWSQSATRRYCCVWQWVWCWIQMGTGDARLPWRGVWFWICTKHCSYFGTSHTEFFNRVGCRKRAKCGCFLEIYCDFHSENISNENQANIGNRFTIVWLQVEVFTAYLERNGLNDCISWIFRPQSGKR